MVPESLGKEEHKKEKRPPKGADSPITIGGGAGKKAGVRDDHTPYVKFHFDHDDYVPDPKDQDTFVNRKAVLDRVTIDNHEIAVTKEDVITIKCRNPISGKTSTITITGDPVAINFNPDDYPYDYDNGVHTSALSTKPRKVVKVDVSGDEQDANEYPDICVHTAARRERRVRQDPN